MIIQTFNKHKPLSAYVQVTWILSHVREGICDGMEGSGIGRQTQNKVFLLYA